MLSDAWRHATSEAAAETSPARSEPFSPLGRRIPPAPRPRRSRHPVIKRRRCLRKPAPPGSLNDHARVRTSPPSTPAFPSDTALSHPSFHEHRTRGASARSSAPTVSPEPMTSTKGPFRAHRTLRDLHRRLDVPAGAAGDRHHPGETRARGRLPGEPGLLRPDARQHRVLRASRLPHPQPCQDLRAGARRRVGRRRRPLRLMRRGDPPRAGSRGRARGRQRPGAPLQGGRGEDLRALRAAHRRPGGDRRRRLLPPPGHLSPDLPLDAHRQGRRPPPAAPGGRRRHRPGAPARRRGVLRLRRYLLDEELRDLHGHARRQGLQRHVHPGRGAVHGRLLLPHARRRRSVPPELGGADHAPGRDPGLDQGPAPTAEEATAR